MLYKIILIGCLLASIPSLSAQSIPNSSDREYIVMLQPWASLASLVHKIAPYSKSKKPSIDTLSRAMKIYLFKNIDSLFLSQQKEILSLQNNPILSYRTSPNDYYFGNQWALDTLQIQKAWAVSTGGLSPNRDTIVTAIIDGSFDVQHEDLKANIWHNRAETPNNQVDDDNNGWIDDYTGWQLVHRNDRHDYGPVRNHGTAILGIIGAVGNNSLGVTGINWQAKMLLLSAESSQQITKLSNIIEGYSYILALRKRYQQTNGQEGAYIVATNASWGIDFAAAQDYPLWCALFDSLGKAGILSVAATANKATNVDQKGDMPCSCPSPYLITVQESSHLDRLKNTTAYGQISIDLAAPAASTSSRWNNSYGIFGGTSGAAPHVTGAVSLLYSYPAAAWGLMQRDEPKQAALLVKSILLNSVDKKPSFRGKSVSNGRLNIGRAMSQLEEYFSKPQQSELLLLYPSPARSQIAVKVALAKAGKYFINFYAENGKKIKSKIISISAPTVQYYHFDIQDFSNGLYIVELVSEKQKQAFKFIKF